MSEATARDELVSAVDGAWLRMDTPTNAMVITSVLVFDGPLDHARLERVIRERLLTHARFRQRVVRSPVPLAPAHWQLDPGFDLRSHFHHVALPKPGDEAALRDLLSDIASTPLDRERPLWQLHHVEGYGPGSVVVSRVHHAVGDGVALVALLLSMTDEGAGLDPEVVGLVPDKARGAFALARQTTEQAVALGRLLLLPADPPSALKGPLGVQKRLAWSRAIPLDALRAAAHARAVKLNDLLMAALTASVRGWLASKGALPETLRALVPVYVRGRGSGGELGNHFGLVFVPLPVGVADGEERVRAAKAAMDEVKAAPDALVALGVLAAMGVASEEIERIGIDIFTRKASLLATNVPGPPAPLHLGGARVSTMLVWAPVSGHIGLGASMLSYAGELRFGVSSDAGLVPDPHTLVAGFEEAVAALVAPRP